MRIPADPKKDFSDLDNLADSAGASRMIISRSVALKLSMLMAIHGLRAHCSIDVGVIRTVA